MNREFNADNARESRESTRNKKPKLSAVQEFNSKIDQKLVF
jgi:hypothetical protein